MNKTIQIPIEILAQLLFFKSSENISKEITFPYEVKSVVNGNLWLRGTILLFEDMTLTQIGWIVNRDVDPKGDRVIAILWGRISTHYDLLILEGDDFVSNRSRQLQSISSRCSLLSQNSMRISQVLTEKSQFQVQLRSQLSQDEEEVDYGSSSLEELYHQEGSQDFDWDMGCVVHV
jgi:hypothetical protein